MQPAVRLVPLFALCALMGACGGSHESTAPPDPTAVASVIVTAAASSITIGKTITLSAQALNLSGAVISGKTFAWSTSSNTIATVRSDGLVNALSVGSVTITATVDGKFGSVSLTAIAPVPASIIVVNGAGQSGSVLAFIGPKDPGVRVLDADGVGIAGVSVSFTPSNGGSASSSTVTTDSHGDALVRWQLGPLPMMQSLRADAGSLSVTLSASAQARFLIAAGNNQSGRAGTFLGPQDPGVVLLTTGFNGAGVAGASIQFTPSGNGAVSSSPVLTNAVGDAGVRWQLSTAPGVNTLTARAGDSVVTFVAQGICCAWSSVSSGTNFDLFGVWATSATDAWAVGDFGTILHYSGTSWSSISIGTPITINPRFLSVWGSSSSDVWAVGYDGNGFGSIVHYDGTSWSRVSIGTTQPLSHVWGASASDVWAVGSAGTILHYNGASWSSVSSGTTAALVSIWSTSASDVWAVGNQGATIHYNGTSWSSVSSGTSQDLLGVWGSSSSDVWAVGFAGTFIHYNGTSWSTFSSGTNAALLGIWGSSASDMWIVGRAGKIFRFNGVTMFRTDGLSGTIHDINGVWGSSASDVWLVGGFGTILHGSF
jgi:hypothetical protein